MHYIVYDDEQILCLHIVKSGMALVFHQWWLDCFPYLSLKLLDLSCKIGMTTVDGKKSFDLSSVQYFPAQQKLNRNLGCDKILLFKTKVEQGIHLPYINMSWWKKCRYQSRVPIFTLHDVGITGNKYVLWRWDERVLRLSRLALTSISKIKINTWALFFDSQKRACCIVQVICGWAIPFYSLFQYHITRLCWVQ